MNVGGFDAGYRWSHSSRPRQEAVAEATRHWREAMVKDLSGTSASTYALTDRLKQIEKRLRVATG